MDGQAASVSCQHALWVQVGVIFAMQQSHLPQPAAAPAATPKTPTHVRFGRAGGGGHGGGRGAEQQRRGGAGVGGAAQRASLHPGAPNVT